MGSRSDREPLSDGVRPLRRPHLAQLRAPGPLPRPAQIEAEAAIAAKVNPSPGRGIVLRRPRTAPRAGRAADPRLARRRPARQQHGVHAQPRGAGADLAGRRRGDLRRGRLSGDVLPWVALEGHGVRVKLLRAPDARVDAELLADAIGPRTRVVCLSWVFSFFGHAATSMRSAPSAGNEVSGSSSTPHRPSAPGRSTCGPCPSTRSAAAAGNGSAGPTPRASAG